MNMEDNIASIKGIGPKKRELLKKLNIETLEDMLYFFPRTYQDRRNVTRIANLKSGGTALVRVRVLLIIKEKYGLRKKQLLRLIVDDGSAKMEVVFFNAYFLTGSFKQGDEYDLYGKVIINKGKPQMIHPDFQITDSGNSGGILPIYPLTMGITQKDMRKWQREIVKEYGEVKEYLSEAIAKRNNLCSINYALKNIHFPEDEKKLNEAKYRLVFDEFLMLQAGLSMRKRTLEQAEKGIVFSDKVDIRQYTDRLPYKLTNAQQRVINEIMTDMESPRLMNRLVQGDVGSGKTAIGEIALFKAVKSGYQGALMAPTELLAKQHFETIYRSFEAFSIKVGLLVGSMNDKEKKSVIEDIEAGKTDIVVGTHALIQPSVVFRNLGIVITDEQHRFGVNQRRLLNEKGDNPDILVMTATPIPRTLAVIVYGDLDISIIDELPKGRQKIITRAVDESSREAAYDFLRREVAAGKQAYIVAPLISDTENMEVRSAEGIYEEINNKFKNLKVALLHGEMKQSEKDKIIKEFQEGKTSVIVSTVIIEVGINIPNATIMIIENAERFGLAQLHQLRGRVGRGSAQSYCILITEGKSKIAIERAEIMVSSANGFVIAEKDLELRGPGEFFGLKQHGIPNLRIADFHKHRDIMEKAAGEVKELLREDPMLKSETNCKLRVKMLKTFGGNLEINI